MAIRDLWPVLGGVYCVCLSLSGYSNRGKRTEGPTACS